eukprot:TRINITY_DN8803_c0_g2_i1.p1 TRINITY_DN8803_c0_g2~~TRINITY_DN8803_c0_g2_i1.p1  ORF type:complete len:146 (+),score=32.51 TRINITY_DN8803_c0_g2_i1:65-502(+)
MSEESSSIIYGLTDEEKELVTSSWSEIEEKADANDYFKYLYQMDEKSMKPLFSDVISKGAMVYMMFSLCTRLVQGDPDAEDVLVDVAERHRDYGVKLEYFHFVKGAFINTVRGVFKEKYTPELGTAWSKVWDCVAKVIAEELEDE